MRTAQHLYGSDAQWWKYHQYVPEFSGTKWTQAVAWKDNPEDHGIRCLRADIAAKGLSTDPQKIHTGKNSGYAAINLALHLGAERVLLLGYDMQFKGKRHWFGSHPEPMDIDSNYASFLRQYRTILPERYGLEIWNVSRQTALDCFPRYNLDELLEQL